MSEFLLPFLAAFACAVVSAWGVGGGALLLLVMTLFLGVDQTAARSINLLFFLPTAAAGLISHLKNGFVDKPTLRSAVPFALLAAAGGALLAGIVPTEVLRKPFGAYLLFSAASILWPNRKK